MPRTNIIKSVDLLFATRYIYDRIMVHAFIPILLNRSVL